MSAEGLPAASAPSPSPAGFDWSLYADATFAGLAVLVPLPVLDWLLERFFRRRMAPAIARRHGQVLPPPVRAELAGAQRSCVASCLGLLVGATIGLVKRISRKLLYVLTIKDATDQLSFYWQRAFLLDHMIAAGHLESPESARLARLAMEQVLASSPSPFRGLAQQVIAGSRHILRTLLTARNGREDDVVRRTEARMRQDWSTFAEYLAALAARYDQVYQELGTGTAPASDQTRLLP